MLLSKGHQLTILNSEPSECEFLSKELKARVILGSGTGLKSLKEAETDFCDVLITLREKDQDNFIIGQVARTIFKVPHVLALVNNFELEEVFRDFGIKGLSNTKMIADLISQNTIFEGFSYLMSFAEGKVVMTQYEISEDSPVNGVAIKDVHFPRMSLVSVIFDENGITIPGGETPLRSGQKILVISDPENIGKIAKIIEGD
jgi:trk system potassium uptake protein TrkA